MKRILLVCDTGLSTSLLVTRMQKAAKDLLVETDIWAVSSSEFKNNYNKADICLVGPQISYLIPEFNTLTNIPILEINNMSYSRMDGLEILEYALKILDGNRYLSN